MKNWIAFIFIGMMTVGCVNALQPKDSAKVDSLDKNITVLEEGLASGKITAEQFIATVKNLKKDIGDLKDSKLTVTEVLTYGGVGGIGGRTALHALRAGLTFLPGPWGALLSSMLGGLLGGSGGLKPKEQT